MISNGSSRLNSNSRWTVTLKSILLHRVLIYRLVLADIRERYFGSFFGLWGYVITPLVMLAVYTFIFSGILQLKFGKTEGTGNFAVYLFCGFIPWMAFSEPVQRSTTVLWDQRTLIKRFLFPREVLPLCVVLSAFFSQMVALISFLVVLPFAGYSLGACIIALFAVLPFQFFFTMGLSLLCSSMNLIFRDIGVFLGTLLQVWFLCTPIFYPESLIPERFLHFLKANPMFHVVRIYRNIILENTLPEPMSFGYVVLSAVAVFFAGLYVFRKMENRVLDYL